MNVETILENITDFVSVYGIRVIGAILIWIIGSWVIKALTRGARKFMTKKEYDESLQKFLLNLMGWALKILLVVIILGKLGVETTSFAAILAAAGLAIGLALQGSLANFAGGVLLMIFKPFKIGDVIQAQGEMGKVKEIEIFTTKILTKENRLVIIPNGVLSNGNITNYTAEETATLFLTFGVSYDADIQQTKDLLMSIVKNHPLVLSEPEPKVLVSTLNNSSVDFSVRPTTKTEDFWTVYFDLQEQVKLELDKAGIEIPYPHVVEIQKQA